MAEKITFIHTADLHLGAPFKGLRSVSSSWADILVKAIPAAYNKLIDTALEQKVDFVVMAGDIFDGAQPSYADFSYFTEGLKRLGQAHISVYLCAGNHDPYSSWHDEYASLPENAHVLGAGKSSFEVYKRKGCPLALLGGRGYYNHVWPNDQNIAEGISRKEAQQACGTAAPFMVGVLHTGLDIDPTRSPVNPRSLLNRGVDYWACGHIHQPQVRVGADNPQVVFSGCPQGRDIKEEGAHGVYKVTLEAGCKNRIEFIPTAQVVWQRLKLDISECKTISEVQELLANAEFALNAKAQCQYMIFRPVLCGRSALHDSLNNHVLDDMRSALNDSYPFFFIDALINETQALVDTNLLRAEGLFPAVYLDVLDAYRKNKDSVLSDLEKEFRKRDCAFPDHLEKSFDELCVRAQTTVLDLLLQGARL